MKTTLTLAAAILCLYSFAETTPPVISGTETGSVLTITILDVKLPSCNGASNASVTIEVKGGKAPYTYSWNTFPAQTTPQAINLKQGLYFIQVTDAEGAVHFESVQINDPIQTTTHSTALLSAEKPMVEIESPAEMSYTCILDGHSLSEPLITDLDIGIHQLVISSNTGCTVVQYIQVFEVAPENNCAYTEPEIRTETTPLLSIEALEADYFNVAISMVQE
ncbi:MAG: SprB repeat-containing protein [Bacteroidetes bacterium]|nr:SprB repeat-containing protein [Bacteroidota bacterium]